MLPALKTSGSADNDKQHKKWIFDNETIPEDYQKHSINKNPPITISHTKWDDHEALMRAAAEEMQVQRAHKCSGNYEMRGECQCGPINHTLG